MLVKSFVTTRTEVKKHIDLPYYSKENNSVFYRINEDESVLKVAMYGNANTITLAKRSDFSTATWFDEAVAATECSKDEVEDAVRKVLEFMDSTLMAI